MRDSWQEKLQLFLLHRIPLVASILLMFLFFMPINSTQLNYFRPAVGLICVYYWSFKRGYMFSYISAFIIGFLIDIYSSSLLGLNALLMMIVAYTSGWFARHFPTASFGGSWVIFALISLGYILLKWFVFMAYFHQFLSINEIFYNYISTLMFYPIIAMINVWVQNMLPQERLNE